MACSVVYFSNIGGALIERGAPILSGRVREMRVARVLQRAGNPRAVAAYPYSLLRAV